MPDTPKKRRPTHRGAKDRGHAQGAQGQAQSPTESRDKRRPGLRSEPGEGEITKQTGNLSLFAPAALGLSGLLAAELSALGAKEVRTELSGVALRGDLELAYRACLWSRLASRVVLQLARFPAPDGDALYAGVSRVRWAEHLEPEGTLAVNATGTNPGLRHTGYTALKVKDAIVDQLRQESGVRPSVDLKQPDLRVNLHVAGRWATLGIDLSGEALHRRGYRVPGAEAPLKETVAAAVLLLLGWPDISGSRGALVDPMAGGGTLPIEAALMAGDVAPGLLRERFGFHRWRLHDQDLWHRLKGEANARALAGRERIPPILGFDADRSAVAAAQKSISLAGLSGYVHVERRELGRATPPSRQSAPGLVAVNPPYGARLGERGQLRLLYASLGHLVTERFPSWRTGVLTGDEELAACLGLVARRRHALKNGGIDCELHVFEARLSMEPAAPSGPSPASTLGGAVGSPGKANPPRGPQEPGTPKAPDCVQTPPPRLQEQAASKAPDLAAALSRGPQEPATPKAPDFADTPPPRPEEQAASRAPEPSVAHRPSQPPAALTHRLTSGAEAFGRRLAKRARHLGRWASRQGITCYRVYDADLPDYAVAIDRYEGFVHVQEYAPPKTVDPARAAARLADVLAVTSEVLGVPTEAVFLKVRRRQRGPAQYQKLGSGGAFHEVGEGGHRFWVSFTDYIDTGLFLDHRLVRARVGELAGGRRFLNLFGYTGSATVYAGKGGALATTTVDLSQTYLGWAGRNLALNGLTGKRHRLERADCMTFLSSARDSWDLVYVDPPTFSNSKALPEDFEVQKDHSALLQAVGGRLARGGVILFSCNYRRFALDRAALAGWDITDLTRQTLPKDFARNARIHQVYELRPA